MPLAGFAPCFCLRFVLQCLRWAAGVRSPSRLVLGGCAVVAVASSSSRFSSFVAGASASASVRRLRGGAALVVPLSFGVGLGGLVAAFRLARWLGLSVWALRAPGAPGSLSVAWWLLVAPSRASASASLRSLLARPSWAGVRVVAVGFVSLA